MEPLPSEPARTNGTELSFPVEQTKETCLREQRLVHTLMNDLPVGVAILNLQGIFIRCNRLFDEYLRQYTSYTGASALGEKFTVLLQGSENEVDRWMDQVLQSHSAVSVKRAPLLLRDNTKEKKVYWNSSLSPLDNDQGEIEGLLLLTQDVTAEVEAEAAHQESETRYRMLVDNSPSALFLHADGKIVYANHSAEKLMGATFAGQLVGLPIYKMVHPDYYGQVVERVQFMYDQLESVPLLEEKIIRLDGTEVEVEISATPLISGGKPVIQVFGRDITERKRVEQALLRRNLELHAHNVITKRIARSKDSHDFLYPVLNEILDVFEMEGGWIQLDEKYQQGLIFSWLNRSTRNCPPKSLQSLFNQVNNRVIQSGELLVLNRNPEEGDLTPEGKGWEVFFQEIPPSQLRYLRPFSHDHFLVASPICVGDHIIGSLGVFHSQLDNTDLQKAWLLEAIGRDIGIALENNLLARQSAEVKLLQEMDRLRSELIANVSHELRTPLGLIKVFTTTLLQEDITFGREMQREFLSSIDEETDRLDVIVNNLLDLSRLDGKRLKLEFCPTNLSELVEGVVHSLQIQLGPEQSLQTQLCESNLELLIDPGRIEQVLRNLVSNAMKYTPEDGKIFIKTQELPEGVLVMVQDNGIGIPGEDVAHIFERFYRSRNAINQTMRGVGLGLPVCKGIVEAHGGRIWTESKVGQGSTFFFTLPFEPVLEDLIS